MKNTLFYNELYRKFSVPLLAVEVYSQLAEELDDEEDFVKSIILVLTRHCGVADPQEADVRHFVDRLEELVSPEEKGDPARVKRKTFGSEFTKFLNGLNAAECLGLMTGYDLTRMRELYCHTDFSDTRGLIQVHMEGLVQQNIARFEATLYGSGNKYDNDSASANYIDANSKDGMEALARFGVGSMTAGMLEAFGVVTE